VLLYAANACTLQAAYVRMLDIFSSEMLEMAARKLLIRLNAEQEVLQWTGQHYLCHLLPRQHTSIVGHVAQLGEHIYILKALHIHVKHFV